MRGRHSGPSPKVTAAVVGRLLFPQTQSLGIDHSDYSPTLQDKVLDAGVTQPSYAQASARVAKRTQLAVSAAEWTLAGAVLYVLLPVSGASFLTVLGAFLLAQLIGLASHVPGGVGVCASALPRWRATVCCPT